MFSNLAKKLTSFASRNPKTTVALAGGSIFLGMDSFHFRRQVRKENYQSNEYNKIMKPIRKVKDYFWINNIHRRLIEGDIRGRGNFLEDYPYSEKQWKEALENYYRKTSPEWLCNEFIELDKKEIAKDRLTDKQIEILNCDDLLDDNRYGYYHLLEYELKKDNPRTDMVMICLSKVFSLSTQYFSHYLWVIASRKLLSDNQYKQLFNKFWHDKLVSTNIVNAKRSELKLLNLFPYLKNQFPYWETSQQEFILNGKHENINISEILNDNLEYLKKGENYSKLAGTLIKTNEGQKFLIDNFDFQDEKTQNNVFELFMTEKLITKKLTNKFSKYIRQEDKCLELVKKNNSKISWKYIEEIFHESFQKKLIQEGHYQFKLDESIPQNYFRKYAKELLIHQKTLTMGNIRDLVIEFEKQNTQLTPTERKIFLKQYQPKFLEILNSEKPFKDDDYWKDGSWRNLSVEQYFEIMVTNIKMSSKLTRHQYNGY